MSISKKISKKLPGAEKREAKKSEKQKLDERREEVLAKGRKFKYPLQFAKHRLVLITVIVSIFAVIALVGVGYAALYKVQDAGDIVYRITKVLPVPIAKIDGKSVRYSDYLMIYRSSIIPVEEQSTIGSATDIEEMKNYYKREALTEAEDYAYAEKLAEELGVNVSEDAINEAFEQHRTAGGADRSKESFLKVLADNFGMSEKEYRRMLKMTLLKAEVAKKVDERALATINQAKELLEKNDNDMQKVADELGEAVVYEESGGLVSMMNVDGGRATKAYSLDEGAVSEVFVSSNGNGYYIVKTISKGDAEVEYQSIEVSFTELDERLAKLREENKVEEYIEIPETGEE